MKKGKKTFEMNDDYLEPDGLDLQDLGIAIDVPVVEAAQADESAPRKLSVQVDEVVQGLSGAKLGGQVYLVDTRRLEPYPDQPFRQYPVDRLQDLADDIRQVGILSPILTRRHKNRLQILAGHNRWAAAKLAGLAEVPVMVLEVDDDQAVLVLTSTNLRQREKLLPSEKAFAYKMQMDALKRQGQRDAAEGGYNASTFITQQTGDSRMQIHRFVRLAGLEAGLLELLDRGKISMTPAVAVSYLDAAAQQAVLRAVREYGASLTIERANTLKDMAGAGALTAQTVDQVMLQSGNKTKKSDTLKLRYDRIGKYLPRDTAPEEAEKIIVEALRLYAKTQKEGG